MGDAGRVRSPILPRPYPDDAFDGFDWASVTAVRVAPFMLVPTQECVRLDRLADLADGGAAEDGDEALHVVRTDRGLLIHDGHTRWVLALIKRRTLLVRIAEPSDG